MTKKYLAVDLGASSGRCILATFDGAQLDLQPLHQFENKGVSYNSHLHWDEQAIWTEIKKGFAKTASQGHRIQSIGVDSWGVDFGVLDQHQQLIQSPYHYRDSQTRGAMEEAFNVVSKEQIFSETGLQFMELNSLFQLFAMQHNNDPAYENGKTLLMMPDLFHWMLCGETANEHTNASTTQLYNPVSGDWSTKLIQQFGFPPVFQKLVSPSTRLGKLKKEISDETGLNQAEIVVPCTHDTASAVLAVPAEGFGQTNPNWCYISSGTWSLMGLELAEPRIDSEILEANFTNETGIGNTTRLLKNISGLWMLQQCQEAWKQQGPTSSWEELIASARSAKPLQSLVDPDDPGFVAPDCMLQAIRNFCQNTNQPLPESKGEFVRCCLESLALKYRLVFERLQYFAGNKLEVIHIVGGGSQNELLCQLTADACNTTVLAGPIEATALGNALAQMIGDGSVADCHEAREVVRRSTQLKKFEPANRAALVDAFDRYDQILAQSGRSV